MGRSERIAWGQEVLGSGRGVVISGLAGMGKTTLARSITERLAPRPVLWLSVTRSAATIDFGPIAPLLAEAGLEAAQPHSVLATVAGALRDRLPHAVVVVDDAHLVDDASAAVVHRLAAESITVVATVRAEEQAPDAVVALWADGLADRLDLDPLDAGGVAAQMEDLLRGPVGHETVQRVHALTNGNPLFVREIVLTGRSDGWLRMDEGRWCAAGGPPPSGARLKELIAARLLDCPPPLVEALEVVAVAEQVELAALRTVVDIDAIVALEDRQLLRVVTGTGEPLVTIDHPIIAEVIRSELGGLRRATHADRLVEAIGSLEPHTTDRLLRLGELAERSSDPCPERLLDAARAANAMHDFRAATRFARAATEQGGGVGAALAWSEAAASARDFETAERVARQTLELEGTSSVERVQATVALATVLYWGLGRADDAEAELGAVEAASDEERQRLDAELGFLLVSRGFVDRALALSRPLLDPGVPVPVRLRAAANTASALSMKGRLDDVDQLLDEYLPLASENELAAPRAVAEMLFAQVLARCLSGGAARTVEDAEALIDMARDAQDIELEGAVSLLCGVALLGRGHVAAAIPVVDRALEIFVDHDTAQLAAWGHAIRARLAALAGDAAAVDTHLALSLAPPFDAFTSYDYDRTMASARAAMHRGDRHRAISLAIARAEEMRAVGRDAAEASLLDLAVRLGHLAAAERLAELAAVAQGPLIVAMAEHAGALATGDPDRLLEVTSQLEEAGDDLAAADAAAAAARAAWELGRKATAAACADRATALLGICGVAAPTLPLPVPDLMLDLTDRELQIALLAAQGRTNREIAEELWLSPRTVGNHLYRAYAKAGVEGRDGLADVLRAAGHLR